MMGERRRTSFTVYGKIGKHPKRFPEEKETWFTTKKNYKLMVCTREFFTA
jgi:hypothetical protein